MEPVMAVQVQTGHSADTVYNFVQNVKEQGMDGFTQLLLLLQMAVVILLPKQQRFVLLIILPHPETAMQIKSDQPSTLRVPSGMLQVRNAPLNGSLMVPV